MFDLTPTNLCIFSVFVILIIGALVCMNNNCLKQYIPSSSAQFTVNGTKYQSAPSTVKNSLKRERYMAPPANLTPELGPKVPAGKYDSPTGNPWYGFNPGGMVYGVSYPTNSDVSALIISDNDPEAGEVYYNVI